MRLGVKIKSLLSVGLFFAALSGGVAIATQPQTSNYSLQSYGFGSGGTAGSSTANYSLEGISGEFSGQSATTTNYALKPGYIETQQANVPKVTLTNPSSYYDKLKFVIDQQNNPNDALYALQVCVGADWTPNCSGTTMYVKSDNTLTSTLTTAEYHAYTFWGGAGGANIVGLSPNTTYSMRAKATQGQYTESGYGPSSNAATVGQSISFCLFSDGSCGSSTNSTSFSGLVANTPASSSPAINLTFSTNANSGGNVYIYSSNGALKSTIAPSSPINSASGSTDLSVAATGYGARITTASSLTKLPPYDGSANNVGGVLTTVNPMLTASGPVSGSATIILQAKAANSTLAAPDYADTVTIIAAAIF
jgi:hypothetical protein